MPIYRKGDDQFELEHRAMLEPKGFKNPSTVSRLLDNPEAKIQNIAGKPRVTEQSDGHERRYTDPKTGEDVHETVSDSYVPGREYPVSGSDIAKLKRGR